MVLTRPVLLEISTFDAAVVNTIMFRSNNVEIAWSELVIEETNNGKEIYRAMENGVKFTHTIPANTLKNETSYRAKIRVYNYNDDTSEYSDTVQFYCTLPSKVFISNLSPVIASSNVEFIGQYISTNNEQFVTYWYKLYDRNKNIINMSNILTNKLLRYYFSGFDNGETYYVELIVQTIHGFIISSGLQEFKISYTKALFRNTLYVENLYDKGSAEVTAHVFTTTGKTTDGSNPIFEDDDWIDATKTSIVYDEENGFGTNSPNRTQKIYLKNIYEDKEILNIATKNNITHKVVFKNKKFHLTKYINDKPISHYMSNEINITSLDQKVLLFIGTENNRTFLRTEFY